MKRFLMVLWAVMALALFCGGFLAVANTPAHADPVESLCRTVYHYIDGQWYVEHTPEWTLDLFWWLRH